MEHTTTAVDRLMALARYRRAGAAFVEQLSDWLVRPLRAANPAAFRKWLEDQETWEALRRLDDRQLKDFGIHYRPPELSQHKFPQH